MTTDIYGQIQQWAETAGISVTALCRRAGVSPGTVTRWRSGVTQPSFRVWTKLERAANAAREKA